MSNLNVGLSILYIGLKKPYADADRELISILDGLGLGSIWNWNGPDVGPFQMAVAWYGDMQISPSTNNL